MAAELPAMDIRRKSGSEPFHADGRDLGFDLLSFWRWSASDLISNTARGCLAEYLVARAIGVGVEDVRTEWDPFDLTSASGVKIEVKSAAYIQSWYQKGYSKILFRVPKRRAWDPETNSLSTEPQRHADVYVFALLAHRDQFTLDPTDIEQWEFYVLKRAVLDARQRSQDSITLKSLRLLCGAPTPYLDLAEVIERAASAPFSENAS
jgi:hypothetical protein